MDETLTPYVRTNAYSVVIKDLPLKVDITVNFTNSKIVQDKYPYIGKIKNFLHKVFQIRHGLGFLKWYG